jgi:hypothetical protein
MAAVVMDHAVRRCRHLAGFVTDREAAAVDQDQLAAADCRHPLGVGVKRVAHGQSFARGDTILRDSKL